MTFTVRLPDGTDVEVPTADKETALRAARKHWARRQDQQSRQENQKTLPGRVWQSYKDFVDKTASPFVDNVVDNLLPNWGDEVRGAGRAVRALATGKDAAQAFRNGQKDFRQEQAAYKRNRPILSTVSAGTGMAAGMVLPAGKALKGATLAQKAAQGAKVGALYGAVSGAGEGDGLDTSRRAANAGHGVLSGAMVGAVLPAASAGGQRAGRLARQYVPGADATVRALSKVPRGVLAAATGRRSSVPVLSAGAQQGNRMAAARMQVGHIDNGPALSGPQASPESIAQEVASRRDVGVPAMLGDTTEAMRDLTRTASRGMGPGQSMVRQRLAERKATEGTRVRQHVADTMPTVDDPIRFVEQQRQQGKAATAPLYQEAYAQPVYRTPDIQAIEQTPAFGDAVPQAVRNIRNQIDPATRQPKDPQALGFRYVDGDPTGLPPTGPHFRLPEGGYVTLDDGLSMEGYDQVIRAMQDAGRSAADRNPVTGRIENTTNSVHINGRAGDLRGLLRQQNGAYDQAVGRYGDDMAYADAFRQGGDIGNLTGHEVNAQARALPEQAHQAYATGAGTALADAASQASARNPNGDTANRVRQMLGDDTKQRALGEIGGNTGAVRSLQDRLEYEHQAHVNWQGVHGSSGAANPDLDREMGLSSLSIPKARWLPTLVDYIGDHVSQRYKQDVKQRVAEIATASDAQTVEHVMQALDAQAQKDQSFSDLMHRAGVGAMSVAGSNVAPIDPAGQDDQSVY